MWAIGAHGSYWVKNPPEDQVFGYDALTSNDDFVFNFYSGVE